MINFVNPRYFVPSNTRFYDLTEQSVNDCIPHDIEICGRTSEDLIFSHELAFLIPEYPSRMGYVWVYKGKVYRIVFNKRDVRVL